MIIDYDHRSDISEEQRLSSLKNSVQRALDEIAQSLTSIQLNAIQPDYVISDDVRVVQQTYTVPGINAHSYASLTTIPITEVPSGYKAIGICGHASGSYRIHASLMFVDTSDNTIHATFTNMTATDLTNTTTFRFYLLCIKDRGE